MNFQPTEFRDMEVIWVVKVPFGSSKTYFGAQKGLYVGPKSTFWAPNSIGQKFIWAWLHFLDHFWIYQGPKGAFWPPIPFSGAPFLVGCCFGQNIGVWGVQTVATERPDHLAHLQPILNLPVGENVQKCPFGGFKRPKMPKKGSWEYQNGMKESKKVSYQWSQSI